MTTWILLRAAGVGAYVMLFLSVAWGLVSTTKVITKRVSKPAANLFHQFTATTGLVLLAIHVGLLLVDAYMPFEPLDVLVPLRSSYRPLAIAAGVLAMYASVAVAVSSWVRRRLTTSLWRAIHLTAVPAFTLALAHGVFAGSDTERWWMWGMYALTGAIVLFLVLVRGLSHGHRPPRDGAARPARPPVATGSRDAERTGAEPPARTPS